MHAACARPPRDTTDAFVGHVGGDDFVVALGPDRVEPFFAAVFETWEEGIGGLYDAADLARGGITVMDRLGEERLHPVASLSVGVATNARRRLESQWEASAIAAEMKEHAKTAPGMRSPDRPAHRMSRSSFPPMRPAAVAGDGV